MKKRILSLLLALAMVFALVGTAVAASVEDYTDVEKGRWYYEYVKEVIDEGYFIGVSDTKFSPETNITRAQMVVMLGRLAGVKVDGKDANSVRTVFTDVPSGKWYSAAVKWAYDNQITKGMTETEFGPGLDVTREDACTFIARFMDFMAKRNNVSYEHMKQDSRVFKFADEADIRDYADASVDECMAYGLVHGYTGDAAGNFLPRNNWRRCEGAKMISIMADVLKNGKSVGGGTGGGTVPPATPEVPADLKSALAAGGNYALAGNATLGEVVIAKGVVSTLDLKGHTLTIDSSKAVDALSVKGSLTVTNGDIIIARPAKHEAIYLYTGFCVEESGELAFENVNIIGDRLWNIKNCGELSLTNATYTVTGGYGIANDGGATVIKDCVMIANGEATSQIYCIGGTMDVSATEFVEGADFESYYYAAPIEVYDSAVTLDAVKITVGADEYSIWAGDSGKVTIKSGVVNTKVACVSGSVTIYGGTVNGVAFENITAASDIFIGAGSKLTQGENCWIIGE